MIKNLLFIQGAGEGAHKEDKKLVQELNDALGNKYKTHYPQMPKENNVSYALWKNRIIKELGRMDGQIILVGHSVGASILVKYLTEPGTKKQIVGVFLLAGPFWGGNGWRYKGYEELELSKGFSAELLKKMPIFFYHCQDDEVVPFDHLDLYAKTFPQANVRKIENGGHQFSSGLSSVIKDIKNLRF